MFGSRNKVCQFYLEGRCKFGDGCKFDHPDNQNQNRFAPLSNQPRNRSGVFGGNSQDAAKPPTFAISAEAIKLELTDERPTWPLSSYGPGRDAPRQLLDVEFEQSPEEMRVLHYIALANGNTQETAQRESSTAEAVGQAIQKILSDINGAMKYVVDGKDQHPNRIDMAKRPFGSQENAPPSQGVSSFGAQNQTQSSMFGQPSNFGRNTQSTTFGQTSAPGPGSSFGQPPALGSTAFGQPSGLGQNSAFGKPSALGGAPAFGKPAFGQSSQPSGFAQAAPAFGQSGFATSGPFGTNTTAQPSFGQPSAFGSAANKPSPFAAGANTAQASPFAAATNTAQASPFAVATNTSQASPFAAAANTAQASPFATAANTAQASPFAAAANGTQSQAPTTTFGQPSAFGAGNKVSPFAAAANNTANQQQPSSTFGQPSAFGAVASQASPFASATQLPQTQSATPFGAHTQTTSPFAQAAQQAQSSPFGAASATQNPSKPQDNAQPQPSTFGQPSQPAQAATFGAASQQNNTIASAGTKQIGPHLSRDGTGRLINFKGQPVVYDAQKKIHTARNPRTGMQERIWFPDSVTLPHKDAQGPEEVYQGDLGQTLAKLYLYVKEHGMFENGFMPEIPPKSEWVAYDI